MGLKPVMGTRLMLSMPAQMNTSPAPSWICPAALWTDCMEEPQKRFSVTPATLSGRPAIMPMRRATLKPCSASGKAQPTIRSSMSSTFTPVRATSSATTWAARSSGRTRARSPFLARVKGERA